uniref:Ig-like domain-containing protein n=1 Tax=Knipowitschia caucasica TaxID=637954 RepID=A0AAV2MBJ4_KNICA
MSVTLTCSSDASPPVESFAWFKDMDSGSIPDSFRPQLHLLSIKFTDRGEYFCVARNSLGTDRSRPLLLNVTFPPKNTRVVVFPPRDIREGSSVNLSCSSQANPPATRFTWYRIQGDQALVLGSVQNLTLPSVRAHNSGQYYCSAWNPLGYQTSPFTALTILYPPKNTSVWARPSGVVDAGRPLTLTCSSQANPAVDNFTWHRLPLEGSSAQSWGIRSGPVFTFSEVGPEASGRYYCEARNRIGVHSSPVLTVRVRGRLKVIALASAVGVSAALITLTVAVMISKNMHRVDMESLEMQTKHSSLTAETVFYESPQQQKRRGRMDNIPEEPEDFSDRSHPDIIPLKDAPAVTNAEVPSCSSDDITVHFSKASSAEQGQDHVRSAPVSLNVQYAPRKIMLSMSPFKDIVLGSAVTFTCSSEANPAVMPDAYRLFKDESVISFGPGLSISDVKPSDSGQYYCQAWNNISFQGSQIFQSSKTSLNVLYPPMNISISTESTEVIEGSDVTLTCHIYANPPAVSVMWYRTTATAVVLVGSGPVLSLSPVEASSSGLYMCHVSNKLGENNSTELLLTVKGKHSTAYSFILAGISVSLSITFILALLLYWRKRRRNHHKATRDSSSSPAVEMQDHIYANALMFQTSPKDKADASSEEVFYSTVTIKPKKPSHKQTKAPEMEDSVIYATVARSS